MGSESGSRMLMIQTATHLKATSLKIRKTDSGSFGGPAETVLKGTTAKTRGKTTVRCSGAMEVIIKGNGLKESRKVLAI